MQTEAAALVAAVEQNAKQKATFGWLFIYGLNLSTPQHLIHTAGIKQTIQPNLNLF